jgi:preprotein translocase SecE subunit
VFTFRTYKPGQAKTTRFLIFLAGEALILWGSRSLMFNAHRVWSGAARAWNEFDFLGGVPGDEGWVLDLVVTRYKFGPAATLAVAVVVLASLWWWSFMQTPRWADLLVDMEGELRKVSWPTLSDAWQSTLVVTGFTVIMVTVIFLYDMVIRAFMDLMPKGGV